ncbi:MAG: PLP-dependent aminotransferase family protein [Deltaproteobacteria bacterium]|nr:MAG: PLP-dependent aminotransferase family protein [Deltaproteobacteria bacterium]
MQKRLGRYKYEEIADEMIHLIKSGTFRPGDRIPSVRQMSRQKQMSVSTVLQAYYLLEARGFIEARQRSGVYVCTRIPGGMPEPEISSPQIDPAKVSVWQLVKMMLHDAQNPKLVQLGAAYPNMNLLAIQKLNRIQSSIGRRKREKSGIYDLPPEGCKALRVQIAKHSVRAGCNLAPGDIVTTAGCTEAINICLRSVCKRGDTIAIESPISFDVLQCVEATELKALEIPTHPREGISLEALEFAIEHTPVQACVVISNFNNPLGSCIPDTKKKDLVALLARHDIPLIENDIFGEIYFTTRRPVVAKSYDQKGLVMLCSSFSKDIAPGYRVGWVAPGLFKEQVEWLKYTSTLATATLPQLAIAEFLASGGYHHHMRGIRRTYERNVASMVQAVERYFPKGTRTTRPTGGFVIWVQLPDGADSMELYKKALEQGIAITPGYIFSSTDRYRNFIRLNAANWSETIEKAVEKLGKCVVDLI